MLQVEADNKDLEQSIVASLSSLPPKQRREHERVARHRCLSYKCVNDVCVYDFPCLQPAGRTHIVHNHHVHHEYTVSQSSFEHEEWPFQTVVYKRETGDDLQERDERCTPFLPELSSTRICHGSFKICTTELATAYSNKYSFKASGGVANQICTVSLAKFFSLLKSSSCKKSKTSVGSSS